MSAHSPSDVPAVILDTNALMMPVECDVRVFEELDRLVTDPDLVVPRSVVEELDKLADGGGEAGRAASVGRDLVERCRIVETDADYADDAVVELATDGFDGYAVTNDRSLRDRLLECGVRVIGIRAGNTLAVTEP
ncbi:MAG: PIN domain-containing protein [Halobaculum sp.]